MKTQDQVTETFDMRVIRTLIPEGAPMIVVYCNPVDYPGKYVARLYNGRQGTRLIAMADDVETLRTAKPPEMVRISRLKTDPAKVIETWL